MDPAQTIAAYLEHLQAQRYSLRTIGDRRSNLGLFLRFLSELSLDDLRQLRPEHLAQLPGWLYRLPTTRGGHARGAANQNRILSAVRALLDYLCREGQLPSNPSAALRDAREPRTLPRNVLTPKEAKRILDKIDTSTAPGYRDRVIFEVFYATGLRMSELIGLRLADLNLEEGLLRIEHGKGGHSRMVPLSAIACQLLETYLHAARPQLLHGRKNKHSVPRATDRLFVSIRGGALDRANLARLARQHGRAAGIKKRVTCHLWRHSCATHLLKNRANLRHVQEILGHRSLATTQRYLHLTITDLKEAHRKFHPRERGLADP